jgi:hypothetical protein
MKTKRKLKSKAKPDIDIDKATLLDVMKNTVEIRHSFVKKAQAYLQQTEVWYAEAATRYQQAGGDLRALERQLYSGGEVK